MFLFYCFCHLVLSHRFSTKPREIGLLGSRSHSKASTGCPIEIEQVPQVKAIPKHASDKCEQADKTMLPAAQPGLEAEQHIEQQSAPNLPAHGIGAMAEEIAQVERLFDLAEARFQWTSGSDTVSLIVWGDHCKLLVKNSITRHWPSISTHAVTRRIGWG